MAESNGSMRFALRLTDDGLDVVDRDVDSNGDELDSVAEEIWDKGRQPAAVTAAVSEPDEVEGMVRRLSEVLGQLNAMVANAGIAQVS